MVREIRLGELEFTKEEWKSLVSHTWVKGPKQKPLTKKQQKKITEWQGFKWYLDESKT